MQKYRQISLFLALAPPGDLFIRWSVKSIAIINFSPSVQDEYSREIFIIIMVWKPMYGEVIVRISECFTALILAYLLAQKIMPLMV